MKKNILLSILTFATSSLFAQSILLSPNSVETKHSTYESILLKGTSTPNIIGFRHTGTLNNPAATDDSNILLSIEGRGYAGGNFSGVQSALRFIATQNWNANNRGTKAEIFTTENNTALALSRLFINHNGKVGIGNYLVSSPSHQLEVLQASNDDRGVGVFRYGGDAPSIFGVGSRGSIILPSATQSGDVLGRFGAKGHDGTDYTNAKARIDMLSNQTWTSTATGTDIRFFATLGGTSTISEKMVIKGNGNIGINTTDPESILTVNGDFQLLPEKLVHDNDITFVALGRGSKTVLRFGGNGKVDLKGIAGGVDGLILHIYCIRGPNPGVGNNKNIEIHDQSLDASAENRIITGEPYVGVNGVGQNLTISNEGGATLIYDGTSSRWRVIGIQR